MESGVVAEQQHASNEGQLPFSGSFRLVYHLCETMRLITGTETEWHDRRLASRSRSQIPKKSNHIDALPIDKRLFYEAVPRDLSPYSKDQDTLTRKEVGTMECLNREEGICDSDTVEARNHKTH